MRYRKIDPRLWKDEKIVAMDPTEKLVVLYLLTAQSNRIGLYVLSPGQAAEDLGITAPAFTKALDAVVAALDWKWDSRLRVLFIPSWWKYNPPANPNVLKSCLGDIHDLPKTHLLRDFAVSTEHLTPNCVQVLHDRMREIVDNIPEPPQPEEPKEPAAPKPKKPRRKAEAPVPDDFSVTPDMAAWAKEKVPGVNIEIQTEVFLLHHRSKGTMFRDWRAAWMKWMRNDAEWNNRKPAPIKAETQKPKPSPTVKWILDENGNRKEMVIINNPTAQEAIA